MSLSKSPRSVTANEFAALKADLDSLAALVNDLKKEYNAAVTLINELKTDLSEHTHGGVEPGGGTTGAGPAIAAEDAAATAVEDVTITST